MILRDEGRYRVPVIDAGTILNPTIGIRSVLADNGPSCRSITQDSSTHVTKSVHCREDLRSPAKVFAANNTGCLAGSSTRDNMAELTRATGEKSLL